MYTNYTNYISNQNKDTVVNEQTVSKSCEKYQDAEKQLEEAFEFLDFVERSETHSQKVQQLIDDFYRTREEFVENLEDEYFRIYGVHFGDKK